jgi:hypothetical protein
MAMSSLLMTAFIGCVPQRPPKKFIIKTVKQYFDDAENQKEVCDKCPSDYSFQKGIMGLRYDRFKIMEYGKYIPSLKLWPVKLSVVFSGECTCGADSSHGTTAGKEQWNKTVYCAFQLKEDDNGMEKWTGGILKVK